jgi:Xaa-Pro dipeptidase
MNRIKELLSKSKADAILIMNIEPIKDSSFFALSGIEEGSFIYSSLLLYENKPILLVSELEELEAKSSGIPYKIINKLSDIKKYFPKIKNLGINYKLTPIARKDKLERETIDISNIISETLDIKNESEYRRFKIACNIVDKIAKEIPSWIKEGITEKELSKNIEKTMLDLKSEHSFKTIVAFGSNSGIPHHTSSDRKLKKNEIILIDFGVKYKNICSDMTRCFFFGNPSKEILETYNKVKEIQESCINKIKTNSNGKSIYEYVKSRIEKETSGIMNHSLGHGIGYEVHESSTLSSKDFTLKENIFTTVEPGTYIEGKFGVRIEDCIAIRKNKPEILTKASKELITIKA